MRVEKTKPHHWNMADTLTALRMLGSLCLAFPTPCSPGFFAVYTAAGLTDVLDGWLARKTKTASDFGARLDSIADLMFYAVMLIRLFPLLWDTLPSPIWYAVGGIVLLRLAAYCTAAIKFRRFAALHTRLNKGTGAAVFLLPYMIASPLAIPYSWAVCALACAAAVEELLLQLRRKD